MNPTELLNQLDHALKQWLSASAPFGVFATDSELNILYANEWFERHFSENVGGICGRNLFAVYPELLERGFDHYYREALMGQPRLLSHRFHKYLIAAAPISGGTRFEIMQQSALISPVNIDGKIQGTVTMIEDVTERVGRENDLYIQIQERERLLLSEISARKLAEENERLKGSFETLRLEGAELLEFGRAREKLMHRIITSQEEERKRIARDIHDHLGQQLTALRFALELLRQQHAEGTNATAGIAKAQAIAEKLDAEVDYLAWELRPAEIDDIGLEDALRTFVAEWSEHFGIRSEFNAFGLHEVRLKPDVEINLYRIAQESLNNIAKHANAARASVMLERRDNSVVLIVDDDGDGFDAAATASLSEMEKGMGLFGMKERAALVGGTFRIESSDGSGTSVFVRIDTVTVEGG
ncbi:MAG: ATP-binding protein [Acidobacteriota bacterium]